MSRPSDTDERRIPARGGAASGSGADPAGSATELAPRSRLVLTVMWCSFLSASVATMVFFAFVDPAPIVAVLKPTAALPGRTELYSLGFIFFWTVCALASSLTAWLVSNSPTERP